MLKNKNEVNEIKDLYDLDLLCNLSLKNNHEVEKDYKKLKKIFKNIDPKLDFNISINNENLSSKTISDEMNQFIKINSKLELLDNIFTELFLQIYDTSFMEEYSFESNEVKYLCGLLDLNTQDSNVDDSIIDLTKTTRVIVNQVKI
ncbi:hypothetical protein MALH04_00653 [Mycoplasma anatis]|uniref:Uncharacterized protein n=1 Tax=Mycoplasmopsis anatis TaxID=171279 RepID=A0A9Q3QDG1_9BACT|nr:hypothetical protein [Mycoplasmopsis anatis]MBW0594892.1 hypothetical protein [Mycoplasmopsis anatis]MBW0595963.1 hypothetical protein [Mycoplasmopsis anatis]MBW0597385.1 hypothetical protein [Mycoplasmopsis anatis]MBW0598586.1 hypothetical protein [Mycoplasmopsis anatis]MBW0599251.1 hypothetical protein [Mycoplasmopsis anatis]